MQELGGAKYDKKKIVPIVWDMAPSELPGWVSQSHALDLRGKNSDQAAEQMRTLMVGLKKGEASFIEIVFGVIAVVVLAALASRSGSQPKSDDPLACPNCSDGESVFRMSPIPPEFAFLEDANHECSRCKYKALIEST